MKEPIGNMGIRFDRVSLSYGEKTILDEVSFYVGNGDFVGLVGPNGAGKTTLIRLIIGEEQPDSGVIAVPKSLKIGYMPQELFSEGIPEDLTGESFMLSARGLDKLSKRLEEIYQILNLGNLGDKESLLGELGKLQEEFERKGGYESLRVIKAVFFNLGIPQEFIKKPISTFSGGLKRRLLLARILYSEPDLLLLDEPTNHLDEKALLWLGDYLKSFQGTVIAVSHHQGFLDKFCQKIFYLNPFTHKVEIYRGNYSFFLSLKDERERHQAQLAVRQEEEIRRLWDFVNRYRAGSRARQAQSRLKALKKMQRIEAPKKERQIKVAFPVKERSGDPVITIERVSKVFGDKRIFPPLSFSIRRGERILVDGPNGAGKTTLLKIIAGLEKPTEGAINLGYKVRIGYYDQEGKTLNPNLTPLDQLENDFPGNYQRIMQILSFFSLTKHSSTMIKKLSQGEKSRLVLAQLMMSGANFLVLDEPTNHLDIQSKKSLANALSSYEGTVILVSHDEEFLSDLKIDRVLTLPTGEWRY
jgi:ATPase subunit of ABC transporter with duplicated ATPase domains